MNNPSILIIDDEVQIRRLLEINLSSNNYHVLQAASGAEGIKMAASYQPSLILLDIGLPDMSGHEVLKRLREWFNQPIIILSVMDEEQHIVDALDHGATDYLSKPFRSAELLARIRAAIRRSEAPNNKTILQFGDLSIDLEGRTVRKNGDIIKLTQTEFNLLALLAKNEGRVLTHSQILKEVRGVGFQNETQYLRVFVGTLRKKIEDNPEFPVHIHTESGVGYRFN